MVEVTFKETAQKIAQKVLGIDTLETRNSDSLDFHEVSVRAVEEALREAYIAGQASVAQCVVKHLYS